MTQQMRIIDSGVVEGRMNIALGQAMIESHVDGLIPDTLRFLRFPPTALIGRHQALNQEVDTQYCKGNGIALVRRITGGGAIYLDAGQLGWELVIGRSRLGRATLTDLAQTICEAAAAGLRKLGVDAAYRPRNDLEVDGRKIGGTGGFFDHETLFYQGTVLIDMDPDTMVSALRVPQAKLAKRELDSAAQRVVTLKQLLGDDCPDLDAVQAALVEGFCEHFGMQAVTGNLSSEELSLASQLFDEEIGQDGFVSEIDEPGSAAGVLQGQHSSAGGTIRSYIRLQGPAQNRIGSVLLTGDFFVTPPRIIYDLEGSLRGVYLDEVEKTVNCFFKQNEAEVLSVGKDDFILSLRTALEAAGTG